MTRACSAFEFSTTPMTILRSIVVFPHSTSANAMRCGCAPKSRTTGCQFGFVDADDHAGRPELDALRRADSHDVFTRNPSGSMRTSGARLSPWSSVSCRLRLTHPAPRAFARIGGGIQPGQSDQHMQTAPGSDPRPGRPTGTSHGCAAIHFGIARITQSQLESGTNEIPDDGPNLGPPAAASIRWIP